MTPPCTPWSEAIDPLALPHARARALLAGGAPVFLPVNPVEYHGPHLSLHNDALISRGLAGLAHAAWSPDAPFLVTADLEVGVDPVPGPGTQERPFIEVRDRVKTACAALAALGAQRVVLATFHGAPQHTQALQAGVRALRNAGVPAYAPMATLLRTQMGFTPDDLADVWAQVPTRPTGRCCATACTATSTAASWRPRWRWRSRPMASPRTWPRCRTARTSPRTARCSPWRRGRSGAAGRRWRRS
jgi:hypothetical protein